jgi:predicted DNA-binding transcriptional regulator AlpA
MGRSKVEYLTLEVILKTPAESSQIERRVRRSLELFSSLPDDALIEVRVVSKLLGRCPASVWRDVKNGFLASPIKIGNSTRWRVGDVRTVLKGGVQ